MNSSANPHSLYNSATHSHAHSASEYRQPVMPIKFDECCPACQASLKSNPNILTRLRSAFFQLLTALFVIVLSVLRLARLIVAGVLTLIGLIGTGLYIAGQHIIHPDDRRLLPSLPKANSDEAQ